MTSSSALHASSRKMLVTAALPYANGQIHLGHLLEFTQTDIWVRFQKMRGHEVLFICGDDTHGTPIMIAANKRGITPEQMVQETWAEHRRDLLEFECDLSHYTSTNSPENKQVCEFIFQQAEKAGHITKKSIQQLYCNHDKMFLPDRFVKGTCPKCSTADQYGDSCENCGATYQPNEMKSPACSLCGTPPVLKDSEHLLFETEHFREFLLEWLPKHTSSATSNKMKEWFKEPLRAWDISRDAPYFGFEIPGHPGKFFYVWVDAPVGYISGTKQYCDQKGLDYKTIWNSENYELHHFMGKDIVYFHTLFWPSLLKTAGFRTPTSVHVHGYLTLNGQKMSKSKGTQITARQYLDHLPPTFLRYYLASKLNSTNDDMDLNLEDFTNRVNSDLVGKITNLASRGAQMLGKKWGGELSTLDPQGEALVRKFQSQSSSVAEFFENKEYTKAINEIRAMADEANRYFDEKAPWKTIETDPEGTQKVLSSTINIFRLLAIYLKPVIPSYASKAEALFNEKNWSWKDAQKTLTHGKIAAYQHLANRVDSEALKKMLAVAAEASGVAMTEAPKSPGKNQSSKNSATDPTAKSEKKSKPATGNPMDPKPEIEIDQFSAIDLRVALIKSAEAVPEADKLLRLIVDVGPLGERQIFAGIKAAYDPTKLVGRKTVIVANLKPRQMKFGLSSGMVLAAGPGAPDLFILSPDDGAKPGDPVK